MVTIVILVTTIAMLWVIAAYILYNFVCKPRKQLNILVKEFKQQEWDNWCEDRLDYELEKEYGIPVDEILKLQKKE